jgi:hypothetical protein
MQAGHVDVIREITEFIKDNGKTLQEAMVAPPGPHGKAGERKGLFDSGCFKLPVTCVRRGVWTFPG